MTSRTRTIDIIFWFFFLVFGAFAGLFLMQRDQERGFGSVSYGVVPDIMVLNNQDKYLHLSFLRGKVWILQVVDNRSPENTVLALNQAREICQMFSEQKKLHVVTLMTDAEQMKLSPEENSFKNQWFIVRLPDELKEKWMSYFGSKKNASKVYLVDQNAAIRGVYNFSSENYFSHQKLEDHIRFLL